MAFLGGLSAFPITPADSAGHVDMVALRRLIGRLVEARVDSIGLLGSTGTYLYLSRQERRRAADPAHSGGPAAVSDVAVLLTERDRLDSTRATSPLYMAADATPIDTTGRTVGEVVSDVMAAIDRLRRERS